MTKKVSLKMVDSDVQFLSRIFRLFPYNTLSTISEDVCYFCCNLSSVCYQNMCTIKIYIVYFK